MIMLARNTYVFLQELGVQSYTNGVAVASFASHDLFAQR